MKKFVFFFLPGDNLDSSRQNSLAKPFTVATKKKNKNKKKNLSGMNVSLWSLYTWKIQFLSKCSQE